jgi:bacterioferritin
MKGDPKVIDYLNKALRLELTAINQYFLHARMFRNWGFFKLGEIEYRESIDEMKHADRLIERILFLEGLPNLQDLDKLLIGEHAQEFIESDQNHESRAHRLYTQDVDYCEEAKDYISRELFENILEGEEEHIDFLETQLDLANSIGIENYLQSQIGNEKPS